MEPSGNRFKWNPSGNRFKLNRSGNRFKLNRSGNRFKLKRSGNRYKLNPSGNRFKLKRSGNRFKLKRCGSRFKLKRSGNRFELQRSGNRFKLSRSWNRHKLNLSGTRFKLNRSEKKNGNQTLLQDRIGWTTHPPEKWTESQTCWKDPERRPGSTLRAGSASEQRGGQKSTNLTSGGSLAAHLAIPSSPERLAAQTPAGQLLHHFKKMLSFKREAAAKVEFKQWQHQIPQSPSFPLGSLASPRNWSSLSCKWSSSRLSEF